MEKSIRELTRKNPTLQKVFLDIYHSNPDTDYNIIKDTYDEYKKYQNLLKNNQFDIRDFKEKTFEDIYDEISRQAIINEKRKYALSFISKKYAKLLNEEGYELFHSIKEMNLSHEKVNDLVVKKIARYKTAEEFNESMQSFIENSKSHEISAITDKINASNLNAKVIVENHDKNILLIEVKDYESSKKLGSSSWCISTRKSYFDSYISKGDKPLKNKQYFLWDFNKQPSDKESLIGFTLDMTGSFQASHYKNDVSMKSGRLKSLLNDLDIHFNEIYTKKEILNELENSKMSPRIRLDILLSCVDKKEEGANIYNQIITGKRVTDYEWSEVINKSVKNPEMLFGLLEDHYVHLRDNDIKKGVSYNNFKSAIGSLFATSSSSFTPNSKAGYAQNPTFFKLYWDKENVESLMSEKWMKQINEASKIHTNKFNVDLLTFYKKFKNEKEGYIDQEEKKFVVKQIIKRYQHSVGENSLKKFMEWDSDVLNDKETALSLGYMNAEDLQQLNRIIEIANWDSKTESFIFSKQAVIEKLIKNKSQLNELNEVQKEAVKNNINIKINNYDDFEMFHDLEVLNDDVVDNNFHVVLKNILKDDYKDLENYYNIIEQYDISSTSVNRKIIEAALKEKAPFEKCELMLAKSEDPKNVCDFMLECRKLIDDPNEGDKVLNVLSNVIQTDEKALDVLNKINLKTYQPITKRFIPIVLEKMDVNKAFEEEDAVKKLMVKMLNKGDPGAVSSLMSRLNDDNQSTLIQMSEKGKDPLVQFLMDKISDTKKPDNKNKSGSRMKVS